MMLWKCLQQDFGRGIIRESFTDVGEAIHISRAEHKTSSELQRIFSQFVLAMSLGPGPFSRLAIEFPKNMKQVGLL